MFDALGEGLKVSPGNKDLLKLKAELRDVIKQKSKQAREKQKVCTFPIRHCVLMRVYVLHS